MKPWRLTFVVVVIVFSAGASTGFANPLLACAWEQGQTALGLEGSGLVATNALPPEPQPYSPYTLQLAYEGVDDPPLAAARLVHGWGDDGGLTVWFAFMYYVETDGAQWQVRARASDNLPDDPEGDDGDAGTILLAAAAGWNWVDGTFTTGPGHDGIVLTVAPVVSSPSPIWIDDLVVDGQAMFLSTPCETWVTAENRSFGAVKALFR